jgi:H/ACA ribonucleoprotein complex subunit 4
MNKLPFELVDRKIAVKKESIGLIGTAPEERTAEQIINYGIVNVDKPAGPTSHNVANYVQKILGSDKAGHSGTLDPGVTGCLPVSLGRATKVNEALLLAGKEYVCIMHMHCDMSEEQIKIELEKFVGKIRQIPPKKSAVKREEREREVYYIDVLEVKEKDVMFIIGCQAGTYIRKICHDFGESINSGAHMKELRRTKAGPFNESTLTTLYELKDAFVLWKEKKDDSQLKKCIQPIENAVQHLRKVWILDSAIHSVGHGRSARASDISKLEEGINKNDRIAVLSLKGELIALGDAFLNSSDMLIKERALAIKIDKVFV